MDAGFRVVGHDWGETVARTLSMNHPEVVDRLPDASHWVHHDEAERVNELLVELFTR